MNRKLHVVNMTMVLLAIAMTVIVMLAGARQAYAASGLKISAKIPDKAKPAVVKCTWKSSLKKIKFYKIIVKELNEDFDPVKTAYKKKVKKAAGTVTLKKLKKNKQYYIYIEAYNKAGKLQKAEFTFMTTGVQIPYMDLEDVIAAGEEIKVSFFWANGKKETYSPDKAYLYKKAGDGKWKKIKTFKANKSADASYKDRDIKAGETYSYKVRLSDTITVKGKKKTVYSAYSKVVTKKAMNETGQIRSSFAGTTPKQKEMPLIDLDLEMDKYNYTAVFDFDKAKEACASLDINGDEIGAKYDIAEYGLNGGDWQEAKGKVTVNAGDVFSLRLKLQEGQKLLDFTEDRRIAVYNVEYNGDADYVMSAWPVSGKGNIHTDEWE